MTKASFRSSSGFSSMPPSFQTLLRGPSVPRNLTKVPKEQQKLLDRPDSWSVALKGTNEAANVPPEVIQSLKDFYAAHTLPPPAQKPQEPISSALSYPAPTNNSSLHEGNGPPDSALGSLSSASGTQYSWSSSPEPGRNLPIRNSSPALSIKSQIGIESQFSVPSPNAGLPSSPPQCPLPPPFHATKRSKPPAGLLQPILKRPRIEAFPSSSAELEDEMETCIPVAIDQSTSPINKAAARLLTASQAVTSPPCGQGNMIASNYNDAKSPVKSSTPIRRRNMKVIPAADWSSSAPTPADQPIIPFSPPRQNSLPASSDPCIASTHAAENQKPQGNQFVQETPGHERNVEEEQPEYQASLPEAGHSGSRSAADVLMNENTAGNPLPNDTSQSLEPGELKLSKYEKSKRELRTWLDDTWRAQEVEWLPPALQQYRATLSRDSLETLKRITLLADKRGVQLRSLWSESDGPLHAAISVPVNGKLAFRDDLSHESMEFILKAARHAREEKRMPKEKTENRAISIAKVAAARLEQSVQPPKTETTLVTNIEDGTNDLSRQALSARPSADKIAEHFTRSPFEAFRAAYPSYSGSLMDFVRACLVVEYFQRKQMLPKWLYDDFIRAFGDGYIQYMEKMDKSIPPEKPIPAIRWYVGNVDIPIFQKDVVTVANLSRVFEVYPDESKSARSTISPEVSPSPVTVKQSSVMPTILPPKVKNDSHITTPSPRDRAQSARNAANIPIQLSPPQAQRAPDVRRASPSKLDEIHEQEHTPESPITKALSVEPESSPVKRDKGKQRMTDEKRQEQHVPATPQTQRQEPATHTDDDDVVLLSSYSRPRPTPSNVIGQKLFNKQESPSGHPSSSFIDQATSQTAPAINKANATPSQSQRIATVVETPSPARKVVGTSPRVNIEKPAVRRALPPCFNMGPPLRTASPSPAHSTLSESTQDSRVKKPKKTEQQRRRDNERWRRKIEKLAKEGRLPGSTPAPKGGDT